MCVETYCYNAYKLRLMHVLSFIESVKNSIRHTAAEFMKMMPQFTRRVTQREYDFILMNPVKRRMLLKMYCMGKWSDYVEKNDVQQIC